MREPLARALDMFILYDNETAVEITKWHIRTNIKIGDTVAVVYWEEVLTFLTLKDVSSLDK